MDSSERLLAEAALSTPARAVQAWAEWRDRYEIAEASSLLTWAGGYIHRNLVAAGADDPYLAGIYRHNLIRNATRLRAGLTAITALTDRWPIVPMKSFGMTGDTYSRGLRPLADIDFYVPIVVVHEAKEVLERHEVRPLTEVSGDEFTHRVLPQRGSWNFVSPSGADLDLHWRLLEHLDDRASRRLVEQHTRLTDSEFGRIRRLDNELMLVTLVTHHALQGHVFGNGLFDVYHLARSVDVTTAARIARSVGVTREVRETAAALRELVGAEGHEQLGELERAVRPRAARAPEGPLSVPVPPVGERIPARYREDAFLRRPRLYRLWFALGRPLWLERVLIDRGGPLSRGTTAVETSAAPSEEASFPHPSRVGELGTGWHYAYPGDPHRWANIPDARIVFRNVAPSATRVRIVLTGAQWARSPVPSFDVVANGHRIGICDRSSDHFEFALPSGSTIELSLRPRGRRRFFATGAHAQWYRMLAPVAAIEVM